MIKLIFKTILQFVSTVKKSNSAHPEMLHVSNKGVVNVSNVKLLKMNKFWVFRITIENIPMPVTWCLSLRNRELRWILSFLSSNLSWRWKFYNYAKYLKVIVKWLWKFLDQTIFVIQGLTTNMTITYPRPLDHSNRQKKIFTKKYHVLWKSLNFIWGCAAIDNLYFTK